jgi:hypothetical protein
MLMRVEGIGLYSPRDFLHFVFTGYKLAGLLWQTIYARKQNSYCNMGSGLSRNERVHLPPSGQD